MGVDYRRAPPLPAPTESESLIAPTETAQSDLSKVADEESHYSLPDDGTPVTIRTRGHNSNRSQTSLLIEYFEGGKTSPSGSRATERKPSVRVRLTPSKARGKNDHIQITETRSSRKTSLTKRALASSNIQSELDLTDPEDAHSMHSYASATEESNVSRNPIEVEIDPGSGHSRRRRKVSNKLSPLIPAADSKSSAYPPPNMSDISAIPSDSFLDGSGPSNTLRDEPYGYSSTPLANVPVGATVDKMNRKQRGEQNVTQKSTKPERKHKSKSKTSTAIEKDVDYQSSPRRKSRGIPKESIVSAADSSVLSQLTPSHRSYDSHSSSKISINNPKLLETVEDAIRRLILPELDAIKRERSQRETKSKDRGSLSSLTSVSREDISAADKRRSVDTNKSNKSRGREARNDLSPYSSLDQFSSTEDAYDDNATPRHSRDLLTDAALGAAVGAATLRSKSRGDEKRQRRRRIVETPKRELEEKYEDEEADHQIAPPMPLSSEVNPSEITRTSILSAETDRPDSASEQMMPVREVARGVASMESMDDSTTPTRSPVNTLQKLGAQHANISHGDLRALPRKGPAQYVEEYDDQEFDTEYPSQHQDAYDDEYDEPGHLAEPGVYEDDSAFYGSQDVPAPLRYVPYQQERRGLSPIQSVSGYTEGESEVQGYRDSRITHTASELSSPSKSPQHDRELRSQGSLPSNMRSREFGDEESSVLSSGLGYRNTVYTDNSELGPVTSGQAVKFIEGNPEMVHQNFGPESAVASLIDPSMISGSAGGGQEYRNSQISYNEITEEPHSRGVSVSPAKQSRGSAEHMAHSPSPLREQEGSTASHQFAEYELNEYGEKVPQSTRRESPTTSETAITAAALSRAAAAALKKQNQGNESTSSEIREEEFVPEGVSRNRSFKERAKNGYRPDATPRHSVDRLYSHGQARMEASGLPDFHNPDPAIGYGYDDDQLSERRTPSTADGRYDETRPEYADRWREQTTPTQEAELEFDRAMTPIAGKPSAPGSGRGFSVVDTAAAATIATAGAMAASHSRQPSQEQDDEWQRTSGDRKRDTLVTNPYEGASPIANLPGIDGNMLGAAGYGADTYRGAFLTGSPGLGGADEGYISAAPNEAREPINLRGKDTGNIDDPFYTPKDLRLSGMSQGMQTPLFDPATGTGIDRIQSKDIIALMEHLMVRDAQRSARDTEILVTLVRSATEMRNSFHDIKKMLAETEDAIVNDVNANTEKSIKRHLGGPRPFPGSSARSVQDSSQAGTEDLRAKKRNLLRRALQGLSAKGTNDLSRIEDMLIQLLTDVDVLKHQTAVPVGMSTRAHSMENLQPDIPYEQDRGYEPEGNAGTSTASHASQSGHLSIPQSRGASMRAASERKFSDHRISTVQEDEGEYEQQTPGITQNHPSRDGMLSPLSDRQRGGSVPLGTPPQTSHGQQLSASNENTPRTAESRKHKSKGSSSFFPKISRWSETTASSIGKAFRSSGSSRKQETTGDSVHQPPSRSGSDLADFDPYQHRDLYGDDKLHSGFSAPDLLPQGMDSHGTPGLSQQTTASVPYATPEDPKYRAHRDSLNLQHPQPRPGQTERFRTALETSAADYDSPMSPRSADWAGSVTSLHRFPQQNTNRYSDNSAANAGGQYDWDGAASPGSQGPARPPKEPLDAQTPPQDSRANKLLQKQGSPLPYQSVESGYGTATATHVGSYHSGSPRFDNKNLSGALGVPTRRPSGPRAMTPSRSEDGEKHDRRRKRDTFGTVASPSSALSQESETF
ncbi:hypothetical protein E0Z10_g4059 [Xylaria hypoxylon]|uniref:Uncharacterized protein n=1 Tax=Xylaria hypoxylon TaxID=37992 RepID=A0A4Z0YXL3_9PEZI|nr:hypothetical protein E0Z10_g4059 [Xylaria hypoxylon]